MNNEYDFVLYAMFDLEPTRRFECRNYVRVFMSASDAASWAHFSLLEALSWVTGSDSAREL